MKIHIPNSAFLGNIDPFLAAFAPENPDILEITTNDRWISIHPVVLCILASLGASVKRVKIDDVTATSRHYLTRMGLYDYLGLESPDTILAHEPAGRFIPITQIRDSAELSTFLEDMIPLLHLPLEQSQSMRYIVSELVRNVLEHAHTDLGAFVCAQYYKKSNSIRLGIVDRGIGIRKSMSYAYRILGEDDLNAIKLALMPGITGTTTREGGTAYNAGAGLFFIKSIAAINGNLFMLYSGKGMYKLLKAKKPRLYADPDHDNHSEKNSLPTWQGTAVGIDISLDSNEAFTELLSAIRNTYTDAVRERRKARYKKAKFI
jgi:anti-sigma regulatory factor (Ser/Thr protein kinase)